MLKENILIIPTSTINTELNKLPLDELIHNEVLIPDEWPEEEPVLPITPKPTIPSSSLPKKC